jgi:hypothetical protein
MEKLKKIAKAVGEVLVIFVMLAALGAAALWFVIDQLGGLGK